MIKICYFGTAEFSKNILQGLFQYDDLELVSVISQEDVRVGRKKELKFPEVKQLAIENNISVHQPHKLKNNQEIECILQEGDADFFVVVAYGKIIPQSILDIPKYGCINLHGSLLPKYRGASPVQESVKNGDTSTGLTSMYMSAGMDEGDILLQQTCDILPDDTSVDIFQKFTDMGPGLLHETLQKIISGHIQGTSQNEEEVSYCGKISKEDGKILFQHMTAGEIYNTYRSYKPWPGVFSYYNDEILKLTGLKMYEETCEGKIGELIMLEKGRYGIICKDFRVIELLRVQKQGKKETSIGDCINGNRDIVGYNFL